MYLKFFSFILVLSCISCGETLQLKKKDRPTAGGSPEVSPNPLISFSCATGLIKHGSIDCSINYPGDTSQYLKVDIMRVQGSFSNISTCDEGTKIKSITNFSPGSFTDITPSEVGESYSYRACVISKNGQVSSFLSASTINALDQLAPNNLTSWSCTQGVNHGEIKCDLDFPSDISDYALVTLRQIPGNTSPNIDCSSDATEVLRLTTNFVDQSITLATGSNIGETFSYRLCISDTASNSNNNIAITNVQALDLVAPPPLDGLICTTDASSAQKIACTIDFPIDTTDYSRLDIRRLAGTTPPNSDCTTNGQVVYSESTNFNDIIYNNDVSNESSNTFSYRACIYDRSGLLESSLTQSSISQRSNQIDSFSCVTGNTTTGNIDCSIDFPADTGHFSIVEIRRILGATAPNIDCISDGDPIKTFASSYNDQTFTDETGSASSTIFSYRVCVYSINGRSLSNDQSSINVPSF